MTIATGTLLGRYEIRSPLGAGGMGEVYLAWDSQLERIIALKILPAEVASDQQRMRRFIQEARAASALNHPNIITIHEIGQADSAHFIATEFIDGVTLRQHIKNTRMKLSEVLDVAVQVASALAAAHAAGIVHRDIKPENIMLRRDGYLKVLDFGLAKLSEPQTAEAPTIVGIGTEPGVVMGTINYMSPEQARGLKVDARTDIFSLGVVLYEMVTGRVPFEGATPSDVIVAILDREPAPLARYPLAIPKELEWTIGKALRKDREERYQTVKGLLSDLKRLKQRLEFEAELERSTPAEAIDKSEVGAAPPTSSAEYLVCEIKRHKRGVVLTLVTLVIVFAAIAFGLYKFVGQNKPAAPSQAMQITRLTTTGKSRNAAVSPDGKYVAHVVYDAGQQSLWVGQAAVASNVQIVPPADVRYRGLTFSHDGNFIYYVMFERKNPRSALYQVPVLGGASRKLIDDIDSPVTLSPDGKRLAFVRNYPGREETALIIADADGAGERMLAMRKAPDLFTFQGPAWSPDGKIIACTARNYAGGFHFNVVEVRVEDGTVKPVSSHRWGLIGRIAWLSDGSGLVIAGANQGAPLFQIWHLSYPSGAMRRITNDLNNYSGVSLTADSGALVTVQADHLSNIWIAPNGDTSRAKQITAGTSNDGVGGISWTPDGKIVYGSSASGNEDIWIVEPSGSNQKQLTVDPRADSFPSASPDGRYVVFTSNRSGTQNIWRIDIDGRNPKRLTSGSGEIFPYCSPDGKWIVYEHYGSGTGNLWKVPINGGEPAQLIEKLSSKPVISPDGKLIACIYRDDPGSQFTMAVIPFESGQPIKTFDTPPTAALLTPVRWAPDGHALNYIDTRTGISNIWSQPLAGGAPKQLTDFKADQIFFFDWSRDGANLAWVRGVVMTDVVLIRDFR